MLSSPLTLSISLILPPHSPLSCLALNLLPLTCGFSLCLPRPSLHQSPLAPTPPTSPSPVYPLPALSLTFIVPLALLLSPCPLPWIHPRDSPTNRLPCSQVPPSFPSRSIRASGHAPKKPCFLSPVFSFLYPSLTPSQPSSLPSTPRLSLLCPGPNLASPYQTHSTQRVGSRRPHGSLPNPLFPQP